MNIPKRISQKIQVDIKTQCWNWQGYVDKKGYGKVYWKGKTERIHKVIYESYNGKTEKGKEIDHICRNKICCSPAHLELVTHAENCKRTIHTEEGRRNKAVKNHVWRSVYGKGILWRRNRNA